MLAWSEGIANGRQKTRNHGYDVIVGGELFTDYPIKLVTLGTQTQINRPDATSFFPLVGCLPQAAWPERLLSENGTLWHCSRHERGALPMIDRGDIRQAIDRCSNIWASLAGRWLWSVRA